MNPSREEAPSERGLPAKPGGGVFRAAAVRLTRKRGNPLARDLFDLRGDRRNVVVDGVSPIPQHEQSLRFEEGGPSVVGTMSLFREMTPAVDFDDKPGAMAVEVGNVSANRFLALEPEGHLAEPAVPKTPLLVRHVGAKSPGPLHEIVAVAKEVGMCSRHGAENSKAGRRRQTDARSTLPGASRHPPLGGGQNGSASVATRPPLGGWQMGSASLYGIHTEFRRVHTCPPAGRPW